MVNAIIISLIIGFVFGVIVGNKKARTMVNAALKELSKKTQDEVKK